MRKRPDKYKMLKGFLGLCLFSISVTSSILTSLMLISVATTSPIIGLLSLISGVIFSAYFYKNFVLENPLLTGLWKKLHKLMPRFAKKVICSIDIELISKNNQKKQNLTVYAKENILECFAKILFIFSPGQCIDTADFKLKLLNSTNYTKIIIDTKKKLYSKISEEKKYSFIRRLDTYIYSDSCRSQSDKIIVCAEEKGSIGVLIDCIRNKIHIESNQDKVVGLIPPSSNIIPASANLNVIHSPYQPSATKENQFYRLT